MKPLILGHVVLSVAVVAWQASAGVIQLTSPSDLSASDTTLIYTGTIGSVFTSPVSYTAGGNKLTFTAKGKTKEFELDKVGTTYFDTAFPNGTIILYATGFGGAGGPVTIDFSKPVVEFGFSLEEFAKGNYTVSFTPSDGATALGTFTATGNDPNALSFEGARATGASIITSIAVTDNRGDNLGFGPVAFGTVPEPTSAAILGASLIGLTVMYCRARSRPPSRGRSWSPPLRSAA